MNQSQNTSPVESGVRLVLLHPTGSEDPQQMSLAVGLLEWLRHGFEGRHLRSSFWPETTIDREGRRRFILRPQSWKAPEIRRKLELVPTAMAVLHLDLGEEKGRKATLTLDDRRGDKIGGSEFPFDVDGIYDKLPPSLNDLLVSIDLDPYVTESSELFHTADRMTALASLYALERLVAFQAGVGREEPGRLFEPALQCLQRDAAHPIARECLVRLGQSLLGTERDEDKKATLDAYERWSELAPVSPIPPYYMALARQRTGEHEPARGAFEESLRRDPYYGPALQEYAVWLGDRGFVDQGLAVLKQAFGRTNVDGALMDQAGCLLANAGRLQEAEPLFRASIMVGGPHTAYANLARGLLARGEEEEALTTLNNAIATNPEGTQVELLGEIARGSGMAAAKARAMLRGGVIDGIDDPFLIKELTSITLELESPEAAAQQARRLLGISKSSELRRFAYYVLLKSKINDLDTRWDSAVENAVQNDASAAEAFFREVLEAEPEFGHAQFLLAASLERLDRVKEALRYVEAAAASEEGDDPAVLDLLARARADAGNLAGAAQAHHRAASLAPQNPRILRNAAISLIRAGYYYEGTGLAGASLALEPDQPELGALLREAATKREKGSGILGRVGGLLRKLKRSS